MYVGLRMTTDFAQVDSETPINEAFQVMKEKKCRMLMVVDDNKLVGVASEGDIRQAMPSSVTTLEIHELTYLLSKIKIKDIMIKDIYSVTPDTPIEEAALIMHDKDVSGLPVVTPEQRLVGYIDRTIMLDVLVEEMGLYMGGSRITFELEDKPGQLLEISQIIKGAGINIISMSTFGHWEADKRIVVCRIKVDDSSKLEKIFREKGYRLLQASDFGF